MRNGSCLKNMSGMKKVLSFLGLIIALSLNAQALPQFKAYTDGHVDIGIRFNGTTLEGFWLNDAAQVNGIITSLDQDFDEHDVRVLGIFDANTPPTLRPAGSQWDFLGVAEGEPIYILPSSGIPDTLPYLGVSTEDTTLAFLESNYDVEEYAFTLIDMIGPAGSVVAIYLSAINIIANATNEFSTGEVVLEPGEHEHFNWSFSHLGTYDLTFRLEAISNGQVLDQFTGETTLRFQITEGGGYLNYDQWRRTLFTFNDFGNEAISGKSADPVGDGRSNLHRYAFGEFPVHQFIWVEHAGNTYPALRLTQRIGTEDLSLHVESSTDLQSWQEANVVLHENEGRVFHNPGLETRIYRITDESNPRAFLRARAEVIAEP